MSALSSTKLGDYLKRGEYDGGIAYAEQHFRALSSDESKLSDLVLSAQKAINQIAYHLFYNEKIELNRCDH